MLGTGKRAGGSRSSFSSLWLAPSPARSFCLRIPGSYPYPQFFLSSLDFITWQFFALVQATSHFSPALPICLRCHQRQIPLSQESFQIHYNSHGQLQSGHQRGATLTCVLDVTSFDRPTLFQLQGHGSGSGTTNFFYFF